MPRRSVLASLALALVLTPAAGQALDITTCNQIIPANETGVLQNDLVCPFPVNGCFDCSRTPCFPTGVACATNADCGEDGRCAALPAIAIERKGTLDMNDHSITAPGQLAVVCRSKGPCTITSSVGRGEISGSELGVAMGAGKLAVSDVDVHDNGAGIYSPILHVRATLTRVTANDNGAGIRVEELRANDVTANGNDTYGIDASGKIKGVNVTANDNDWGGIVCGRGMKVSGLTATGNGNGVDSHTGAGIVVTGGPLHLADSTVTGNTWVDDEPPIPLDLITARKPKLTNTTCDHSLSIDRSAATLGPTWGVCAND